MNKFLSIITLLLLSYLLPVKGNPVSVPYGRTVDSEVARVSLLTCDPGEQLHTLFGHSAIRVKNSSQDLVFNYGTFNFNTPHFYAKFVSGLLPYCLSVQSFDSFYLSYRSMNTNVYEQVLRLDSIQTVRLISALVDNYRPENRTYLYNFLYDNCSTRIRDIFEKNIYTDYSALKWTSAPSNRSYWNMLDEYLDRAPWSQWGIHTILGDGGNKKINLRKEMFLPHYLMKAMDSSYLGEVPLVISNTRIIKAVDSTPAKKQWYTSPWTVFTAVSLVLFFLSLLLPRTFTRTVVSVLYFITGLIGILIVYLAFTKHPITFPNWNILWAFPLNLPVAFLLFSRKKAHGVKLYMNVYMGLLLAQVPIIFFSRSAIPYATLVLVVLMFYFSYRFTSIKW